MVKQTHKHKRTPPVLIVSLIALGVIILALAVGFLLALKGPSKAYVQAYDAKAIVVAANNTKAALANDVSALDLASDGLTPLATAYADGCYPTNSDTFAPWHKVCFGREVAYFSSAQAASTVHQQLVATLTTAGWKPAINQATDATCYGYPLGSALALNLGFTASYQISSVSAPCDTPISETNAETVPVSAQPNVVLSSLSQLRDESAITATAKTNGAKSIIAIAVEKQYYDKPLGFYF